MILHPFDLGLIALYAVSLFVPMLRFARKRESSEDFFVAGRRVTMPAFVASLVSTWYGGVLGVGEYTYKHGISNWLVFGFPYYIWAAVFALVMAKRAHAQRHTNLPDLLHESYGRPAGAAGSVLLFINTLPAVYALELGLLISFVFDVSLAAAVLAGTCFTAAYVIYGGLRSVIDTDVIQFVLMFAAFAIALPLLYARHGGLAFLTNALPASFMTWHGGASTQAVVVWYIIAAATLVEPAFYQRCYAAKTPETARRGILISILFWAFFDFLTTFTGLYARALEPGLSTATLAFPELGARILPPVLRGLFFVGMLSTIMSTLHGYLFLAGETLGRDLLRRGSADRTRWLSRAGIIVSAAASAGLALWSRSIVQLWHDIGSLSGASLLIPVVAGYGKWHRPPGWLALVSIVSSSAVTLLWILARAPDGSYLLGVEPIFPGLLVSSVLFFFPFGRIGRSKRGLSPTRSS